jgi:hypothetical protein
MRPSRLKKPAHTGHRKRGAPRAPIYVLIGDEPRTDWLGLMIIEVDERRFVLDRRTTYPRPAWPGSRPPLPFRNTSVPRRSAAGAVRYWVGQTCLPVPWAKVRVKPWARVHRYLAWTRRAVISPLSAGPR